jgi:hypothetical protein
MTCVATRPAASGGDGWDRAGHTPDWFSCRATFIAVPSGARRVQRLASVVERLIARSHVLLRAYAGSATPATTAAARPPRARPSAPWHPRTWCAKASPAARCWSTATPTGTTTAAALVLRSASHAPGRGPGMTAPLRSRPGAAGAGAGRAWPVGSPGAIASGWRSRDRGQRRARSSGAAASAASRDPPTKSTTCRRSTTSYRKRLRSRIRYGLLRGLARAFGTYLPAMSD